MAEKLHTVYKAISLEEMERILVYCKQHNLKNKGPFEIYSGAEDFQIMVIVNSVQENEPLEKFKPIGAFYCNYMGEGIISLDQEETNYDAVPSAQKHVQLPISIAISPTFCGLALWRPIYPLFWVETLRNIRASR